MMAILVFLRTGADYDIIGAWGLQPHPVKKKRFHHTCVRSEHVLIQLYESIAVPGFCRLLLLNDDDDDDDYGLEIIKILLFDLFRIRDTSDSLRLQNSFESSLSAVDIQNALLLISGTFPHGLCVFE